MSRQTSNNPSGFRKIIMLLIIVGAAALMISPVLAETGSPAGTGRDGTVTITKPVEVRYHIWNDTVTFSGTNAGSETTYLFITGPNLEPTGAQIQSLHPGQSPVIDGDASTFLAARAGADNSWSYTWDTHNVMIDSGVFTIYAASTPRDLPHINSTHFDRISLIMSPPRGFVPSAGTGTSNEGGAAAGTGVTIAAQGDRSYYVGEKVVFSGHNYDSDSTYLFLTGPGVFMNGPGIPIDGGKLTSPLQPVVSGNPDSFTVVTTKPDTTWEYTWYTANLPFNAGTYTVYAVGQPEAMDSSGIDATSVGIIVKKPFITAEISPSLVPEGQPFTVKGIAEGLPPFARIWIIGDNYVFTTTTPVNPGDATFTFTGDAQLPGKLPGGQLYLIAENPMADNQSDFVISGDYVRELKLDNGTNLFRITGPGSLQGKDAADALIAAISVQEANDRTYTNDTYTIVPFQVTNAGPTPAATPAATAPVQQTTQPAVLPFALIGGIVLVLGIVVWRRH